MPTRSRWTTRLLWGAFAVACVVQLYGLYAPQAPGPPAPPGTDKVVHAAMFGAVLVTGALVRVPLVGLTVVLAVHAVLSEVVQHLLLPGRTGDPADVVADLAGVGLGLLVLRLLRAGQRGRDRRPGTGPGAPGAGPGADS